jgi:flagellin-specific chaperone FliS
MMANEVVNSNGHRLLAMLLDEHAAVVGETRSVIEARAILDADVVIVREDIAARLDRVADRNDGGFKRVLTMLAKRVREGRENADR